MSASSFLSVIFIFQTQGLVRVTVFYKCLCCTEGYAQPSGLHTSGAWARVRYLRGKRQTEDHLLHFNYHEYVLPDLETVLHLDLLKSGFCEAFNIWSSNTFLCFFWFLASFVSHTVDNRWFALLSWKWMQCFFSGPQSSAPVAHPEDELERLTKKMLFDMDHPPSEEYFGEKDKSCHLNLVRSSYFHGRYVTLRETLCSVMLLFHNITIYLHLHTQFSHLSRTEALLTLPVKF